MIGLEDHVLREGGSTLYVELTGIVWKLIQKSMGIKVHQNSQNIFKLSSTMSFLLLL